MCICCLVSLCHCGDRTGSFSWFVPPPLGSNPSAMENRNKRGCRKMKGRMGFLCSVPDLCCFHDQFLLPSFCSNRCLSVINLWLYTRHTAHLQALPFHFHFIVIFPTLVCLRNILRQMFSTNWLISCANDPKHYKCSFLESYTRIGIRPAAGGSALELGGIGAL